MKTDNWKRNLKVVHSADMLPNFWSSKFTLRRGLSGLNWRLKVRGNECRRNIFDEMVSADLMKRIGWRERILRGDSSIFPTNDEILKEVEKVGTNNCIEIGTVQDDGVVCDGEGIIHENIA